MAAALPLETYVLLKEPDINLINQYLDNPGSIQYVVGAFMSNDDDDSLTDETFDVHRMPGDQEHADQQFENQKGMDIDHEFPQDLQDEDAHPTEMQIFECPCTESSSDPSAFVHLVCGCVRCFECLNVNVSVGVESRKSYPPKCQECSVEIDIGLVHEVLDDRLRNRWVQIKLEFADPSPTYCAAAGCSLYIPRSSLDEEGRWGNCPTCSVKTCTGCGHLESKHDPGSDQCPETIEANSLEYMKKNGCKPCPWCRQMIDRLEGCDHMTCDSCGKNFCWNCGAKKSDIELPCNCRGEHAWVDQEAGEHNADVQRQIMERIARGENARDVLRDLGEDFDDGWFPRGAFVGRGRRLGEDGDEADVARGLPRGEHEQDDLEAQHEFNHHGAWREAFEDPENEHFYGYGRFFGQGRRLGEDNIDDVDQDEAREHSAVAQDVEEEDAMSDTDFSPPTASLYRFPGEGRRLGEEPNEGSEDREPPNIAPQQPRQRQNRRRLEGPRRHLFRGSGYRLGE